jgi:tetratricopeptide (TPR) repeat protein
MTKELKSIRIFISSPGDVAEERALTKRVIQRLQGEFSGQVTLDPIFWEHEPLLATKSFQEQIVRPSETDIVVTILWSRLGTRLPANFTKPDGSRYESGTEFEFEDAVNSYRETGTPDLLIYRKTAEPVVSLKDRQTLLKRLSENEALENFFDKWFHDKAEGTLVAAFHPFNTSANFEEILESHLQKLIKNRLPESAVKEEMPFIKPQWQEGSPFRGLNVFEFEHSAVFFGRTKAVSEIIDSLRKQAELEKSFVLILGMSGGGKSSLVRAGVLPMLTQSGVIEGVGLWRRAIMKPGDSPGDLFDGLAASLLRENALPELTADRTDINELAKLLRETPKAAVPLIKGGLSQAASEMAKSEQLIEQPTARLVLVVDQMEEMFSLESITHEERVKFVEALDALARSGRVWVIATLRSDFYPRCTELETLVELKEGTGQYDLMTPTPAEIGQMIRQPAQAAGLHFEEDAATNERLDDVLRDAAAKNPSALPLLEFTLEELYKQRTNDGVLSFESYRKLGGVEGALAQRAEEVYSSLEPTVQEVMDIELHSLISIGVDEGERLSRKYVPINLVTATDETKAFVEAFVTARLFTTDLAADGSAIVSIAHEALLQYWPRLRNWIEKNRESLRIHARIASAARRWEEENKSGEFLLTAGKPVGEAQELVENKSIELNETEKSFVDASIAKRKRIWWLKRIVVVVLAVLTIVAGGAAYLAEQQRKRAETEAETSEQVSEFLVGLFEVSDPSEALGDTITAREILDKGAERIEKELSDQPEVQATLMNTMGKVYQSLGLYEQATPLLESALTTRQRIFGTEHPDVAESLGNLATLLRKKGDYTIAEPLFREALRIFRKLRGDEDTLVANSLSNLASLLYNKGDYAKAEPLYREALTMQRKLLGNMHPDVVDIVDNLGAVLFRLNNYEEAEPLFREALAMRQKMFGDNHPDLAISINNLAQFLKTIGNNEEAEPLFRETLAMRRRLFGDEHPSVATGLNNLAGLLFVKGDFASADSLYREALVIFRKLLGDDHPNVAVLISNLAELLVAEGNYSEAEIFYRDALQIRRKKLSEDHLKTYQSMYELGNCLTALEHFDEAELLLLESYPAFKKERGQNDKYTLIVLNYIVNLYEAWGKSDKVAEYKALLPDSLKNNY